MPVYLGVCDLSPLFNKKGIKYFLTVERPSYIGVGCGSPTEPDMAELSGRSSGSDRSVFNASDSDALENAIRDASSFQLVSR